VERRRASACIVPAFLLVSPVAPGAHEPAQDAPESRAPGPLEAAPLAVLEPAPPATAPDAAVRAWVYHYLAQRCEGLTEGEIFELASTLVDEAARNDIDPALVVAVMHVESRYRNYAVSKVNALGLMQIMPATGEWMAAQMDIPWRGPQTLFDPIVNVRIGIAYLRHLTDRYGGDVDTALVAYNWGPGRIDRRIQRGAQLPTEYAQLVLEAYGEAATRS
jgi:soluble lytic murein transglycosylase-like protein